jgi:hypothetical protein
VFGLPLAKMAKEKRKLGQTTISRQLKHLCSSVQYHNLRAAGRPLLCAVFLLEFSGYVCRSLVGVRDVCSQEETGRSLRRTEREFRANTEAQ